MLHKRVKSQSRPREELEREAESAFVNVPVVSSDQGISPVAFIMKASPFIKEAQINFVDQTTFFKWQNDDGVEYHVRGYHGGFYDGIEGLGFSWPLMYFHNIKFVVTAAAWSADTGDLVCIWGLHASEEKQSSFAIMGTASDMNDLGESIHDGEEPYADSFCVSRQDYEVAELICPALMKIKIDGVDPAAGGNNAKSKRDQIVEQLITSIENEDYASEPIPEAGYQSAGCIRLSKLRSLVEAGAARRPLAEVLASNLIPKFVSELVAFAELSKTKVEWPQERTEEATRLRCKIGAESDRVEWIARILSCLITDDPAPKKRRDAKDEDEEDDDDEEDGDEDDDDDDDDDDDGEDAAGATSADSTTPTTTPSPAKQIMNKLCDSTGDCFVIPTLLRLLIVERHDSREIRRSVISILYKIGMASSQYRDLLLDLGLFPTLQEMYALHDPPANRGGCCSYGHDYASLLMWQLMAKKPAASFDICLPLLPLLISLCTGGSMTITANACWGVYTILANAMIGQNGEAAPDNVKEQRIRAVLDGGLLPKLSHFTRGFAAAASKMLAIIVLFTRDGSADMPFLEEFRCIDLVRHLNRAKENVNDTSPWGSFAGMSQADRAATLVDIDRILAALPEGYGVDPEIEKKEAEELASRQANNRFGFGTMKTAAKPAPSGAAPALAFGGAGASTPFAAPFAFGAAPVTGAGSPSAAPFTFGSLPSPPQASSGTILAPTKTAVPYEMPKCADPNAVQAFPEMVSPALPAVVPSNKSDAAK